MPRAAAPKKPTTTSRRTATPAPRTRTAAKKTTTKTAAKPAASRTRATKATTTTRTRATSAKAAAAKPATRTRTRKPTPDQVADMVAAAIDLPNRMSTMTVAIATIDGTNQTYRNIVNYTCENGVAILELKPEVTSNDSPGSPDKSLTSIRQKVIFPLNRVLRIQAQQTDIVVVARGGKPTGEAL